jgi:hypothetical protein
MFSKVRSFLLLSALVAAAAAAAASLGAVAAQGVLPSLVDAVSDEAELLPCTVADVHGEFARLAQTGVLTVS